MQSVAFIGPALCLLGVMQIPPLSVSPGDVIPDDIDNDVISGTVQKTIALIALALGLNSFSLAGLYCNHQDLSPKYASVLLGVTNTVASIPGVVGVALVGVILDQTHSWDLALFVPSIACFGLGTAGFLMFGEAEEIDFDARWRAVKEAKGGG